ncbi:MAG: hypothetical protein HY814_05990 [Candidatus Riflebacteria bacterium]|nr:hypothetical protein [Candidatus Riflebacteria bacterium]
MRATSSFVSGLLALGLFLGLSATAAWASHQVRLMGAGDQRGLDTFRCVSKITRKTAVVYQDMSTAGLRVGLFTPSSDNLSRDDRAHGRTLLADPEERRAVVRPVFTEPVTSMRGWRVTQVVQKTFLTNTQMFEVLDPWSAGTSPKDIYDLRHAATPVTQTALAAMFQQVLDRGNLSSATNGLYLQGTMDLRVPWEQPLLFEVLLEAPLSTGQTPDSTSVHPLILVTATAEIRDIVIGNDSRGFPVTQRMNVLAFQSSFRGTATIYRQESGVLTSVATNLAVVANFLNRIVVRNEYLRAGANSIVVGVADMDDSGLDPLQRPRGFSSAVTMNNPP